MTRRPLVLLLCAAALTMKLLIPAGYMIANDHGRVAIVLCSGVAPAPMMGMQGAHGGMVHAGDVGDHGKSRDHGRVDMPCAFSGLSQAALGAVDPVLLAALIAFIMALGTRAFVVPPPARRVYLRPPLRGPPTTV